MENHNYEYWLTNWSDTCEALRPMFGNKDISSVANELANIAGDHADMSENEVLATFINENIA